MYIPSAFREDDVPVLHDLMRRNSFAALVTGEASSLVASHLPFFLDADRGPFGCLLGHMARANPQWRDFSREGEALVLFQGPHAYVSPSWYEDTIAVPTWNYAAIHAYGIPRLMTGDDALRSLLSTLVSTHEASFEHPWTFDPASDFAADRMRSIVGFEIEITRLEGKYKLSQNRSDADRVRVQAALLTSEEPGAVATGRLMAERNGSGR